MIDSSLTREMSILCPLCASLVGLSFVRNFKRFLLLGLTSQWGKTGDAVTVMRTGVGGEPIRVNTAWGYRLRVRWSSNLTDKIRFEPALEGASGVSTLLLEAVL